MTQLSERTSLKACIAITLASVIASLASFIISVQAGISALTDEEIGSAVGQGLAIPVIIWMLVHFSFLRNQPRKSKWIAFFAIVGFAFVFGLFGATI